MKRSSKRKFRRTVQESFCTDINGNNIKNGASFVPKPKQDNFCLHCTCSFGQAKDCIKAECAIPTCKNYKPVPGKCCSYTCPSGANSEAAELAIIISLSVGLLLLLILLIVVIDRNRKKNQRNQTRNEVLEQSQNLRPRPLNNRLAGIIEENNERIEPPPPYTPGRGRYSFRKPQYAAPPFTPNEPPPPYEINCRHATDV